MDKRKKGQNLLSKRMPRRVFSSFLKKKVKRKVAGSGVISLGGPV